MEFKKEDHGKTAMIRYEWTTCPFEDDPVTILKGRICIGSPASPKSVFLCYKDGSVISNRHKVNENFDMPFQIHIGYVGMDVTDARGILKFDFIETK